MRSIARLVGICMIAAVLVIPASASAELGAAGQPAPQNPGTVQPADQSRGVAFQVGDVLAGVGSGQIKHFSPTGTLIQTLNNTTGSSEQTGMCFDADGNLYTTNFTASSMSKFDSSGNLLQANFASGLNSHGESCVFDGTNIFVGHADGLRDIVEFSTSGTQLDSWSPATSPRGTDWIDLAEDGCTMFIASEGATIFRYDICTDTQLADFATGLPGGSCYALRIRPIGVGDFEVLVACQSQLNRLDSTGAVIQSYPAAGFTPPSNFLFAMNLDPDGTTFWTGDIATGDIYRVNIASGNQVTHFASSPFVSMAGITIVGEITAGVPTPTPQPTGTPSTPTPTTTPTATATPAGAQPIPTVSSTGVAIFIGLLIFAAFALLVRMRH